MSCVSAPLRRIELDLRYDALFGLNLLDFDFCKNLEQFDCLLCLSCLDSLLGVDCVSSSYRVTVLPLLIVLIYWDLLSIISCVHVLTVWTSPPIKGRTPSHVGCVVR